MWFYKESIYTYGHHSDCSAALAVIDSNHLTLIVTNITLLITLSSSIRRSPQNWHSRGVLNDVVLFTSAHLSPLLDLLFDDEVLWRWIKFYFIWFIFVWFDQNWCIHFLENQWNLEYQFDAAQEWERPLWRDEILLLWKNLTAAKNNGRLSDDCLWKSKFVFRNQFPIQLMKFTLKDRSCTDKTLVALVSMDKPMVGGLI